MKDKSLQAKLNWLTRQEIVALLEAHGFQCYDDESTPTLRTALRVNIEDKTIQESEIPS